MAGGPGGVASRRPWMRLEERLAWAVQPPVGLAASVAVA